MATHSSIHAWRVPWTEEPGRLQPMGSHRVGHDWSNLACTHIHLKYIFINIIALHGRVHNVYYNIIERNIICKVLNSCIHIRLYTYMHACVHAKLLQSCPTLCNPVNCSPPGSSVCEILQARIVEWVAMHSSRGSSQPRDGTQVSYVSCIVRWVLYH